MNSDHPICARIRDLLNGVSGGPPISGQAREHLEQALIEETLSHAFKVNEQVGSEEDLIGRNGHKAGGI